MNLDCGLTETSIGTWRRGEGVDVPLPVSESPAFGSLAYGIADLDEKRGQFFRLHATLACTSRRTRMHM